MTPSQTSIGDRSMIERKRTEALKTKTVAKAASAEAPDPETSPMSSSVDAEGEVQLSLRLRPDLKAAILDEARQRRITVKALVLGALRDAGLPVLDDDMLDRRDGAPRERRQHLRSVTGERQRVTEDRRDDYPRRGSVPTVAPDLSAITAMLGELINRRTGPTSGPNIRISTGCCCGQSAAKCSSSNSRHRRK